jgi:hypothetical protein
MRLLADRLVEPGVFDSVSHETVRQVLKKRIQALIEGLLVHPDDSERGIR